MSKQPRKHITLYSSEETSREQIESKSFLDSSRKNPKFFTRNRKMPFVWLVAIMLSLIKSTIQLSLDAFFQKTTNDEVHMSQQAFSKARDKIYWKAFRTLFRTIVDAIYDHYYDTWHGYRVTAIDGTKLQLPDEQKLRNHFGTMGKSAATGQGSALYDVLNNVLIDAHLMPLKVGERKLAMAHLNVLSKLRSFGKELVLFDRGYPSFEMFEFMKGLGISFLMRAKSDFNNTVFMLPKGDHRNVRLTKKGHEDIIVRVIKFDLPSGEEEILITDIADKRMSINAFKKLYFMRWPIETKYDEIKNKLEVENFSGLTYNAVMQDFWCAMYVSNMAAIAIWDAQAIVDEKQNSKNNLYTQKVNVNHAVGTFKQRFIEALLEDRPRLRKRKLDRAITLMVHAVRPDRTGRSGPRNPSPRNAKFRHNSKSNH